MFFLKFLNKNFKINNKKFNFFIPKIFNYLKVVNYTNFYKIKLNIKKYITSSDKSLLFKRSNHKNAIGFLNNKYNNYKLFEYFIINLD
jgi:hypothetical protein